MKKLSGKLLAGAIISFALVIQSMASEKITVFAAASLTNALN